MSFKSWEIHLSFEENRPCIELQRAVVNKKYNFHRAHTIFVVLIRVFEIWGNLLPMVGSKLLCKKGPCSPFLQSSRLLINHVPQTGQICYWWLWWHGCRNTGKRQGQKEPLPKNWARRVSSIQWGWYSYSSCVERSQSPPGPWYSSPQAIYDILKLKPYFDTKKVIKHNPVIILYKFRLKHF